MTQPDSVETREALTSTTVSAFDFLDGEYTQRRRSRTSTTVVYLAAAVISAGLCFMGWQSHQAATQDLASAQTATSKADQILDSLPQEATQPDGQPAVDTGGKGAAATFLQQHIRDRQNALASVLTTNVDMPALLRQLYDAVPDGASIGSLSYTSASGGPSADGQQPQQPANPEPAVEDDQAAEPSPQPTPPAAEAAGAGGPGTVGTVTITGQAPSLAALDTWEENLTDLETLSNIKLSNWSGSDTKASATFTATITAHALTEQAQNSRNPKGNNG